MSGGGNPCHDEEGKFCSGPSSGSVATINQLQKKLDALEGTGKFSDGPSASPVKKMLETKHGWVEPLPKDAKKKVPGGFTGYKVMNSEGVQVGEVWRNPTGSDTVYTAFKPDGTEAGGFKKKVHAIEHLAKLAAGKTPPSHLIQKPAISEAQAIKAGAAIDEAMAVGPKSGSKLDIQGAMSHPITNTKLMAPSGLTNVVSGHKIHDGDKVLGEVWAAEHKTEKKTKYWAKPEGGHLSKSFPTAQAAVNQLLSGGTPKSAAKSYASNDDIPEDLKPAKMSVGSEERAALRSYGGSGSAVINRHLRGEAGTSSSIHMSPLTSAEKASVLKKIAHIDAAMARNVIGKTDLHGAMAVDDLPGTLYRGAKVSQFGVKEFKELKIGMELQNHAYVSTSRKKSVASGFLKSGSNAVMMHIKTTPKSHGVDMQGISPHHYEYEVLLPRRSKFRIYKIESGVVHVEHIDPH